MKAKVKDTGEIVDVKFTTHPNPAVEETYWWCKDKQESYHKSELDFMECDIDWEQRRYELAKEAMNGLLCAIVDGVNPTPIVEDTVKLSLTLADALIRKLKEK
jgi:hypothetical protein